MEGNRPDSNQAKSLVATDFPVRLIDNFFRRWFWLLVVIAPFAALGLVSANRVQDEYVARGRLSASANPLVDQLQVRGTDISIFESPAAGTARLFNEQLRTDSFVDDVARRAGLDGGLEAGTIDRDVIRERVSASEAGENILTVSSTWGDPQTAFLLVDSTISGYLDYVAGIVAKDSDDALDFLVNISDEAQDRVDAAEADLARYIADLGPRSGETPFSTVEQFQIERLSGVIDRELADLNDVQNRINDAEITAAQAQNEAFGLLRIIDPPSAPLGAESNLVSKLIGVVMFTLIGAVVALGALVLSTALDRSIRSAAQLGVVAGTDVTVALPTVRMRRQSPPTPTKPAEQAA